MTKSNQVVIMLWLCCQHIIYANDTGIDYTNSIVSQIQNIDLKIIMNNKIAKAKFNSMKTHTSYWYTKDIYFQSITSEIPKAISTIMNKNASHGKFFKFYDSDLSNYTQANYNALFLYNLIYHTIKYIMDGGHEVSNLMTETENIIMMNFQNIDTNKLKKAMADITEYDRVLDIIDIVDEFYCINKEIGMAREGKSEVLLGNSSYITSSSSLRFNVGETDKVSAMSQLPSIKYYVFIESAKYPYNIKEVELCFKVINGIVKLDQGETFAHMEEHNKRVRRNQKKHLQDIKQYSDYAAMCQKELKKYKPNKQNWAKIDKLEVEEITRLMQYDYSFTSFFVDKETMKDIGTQLGIEIYEG